ncbi:MAG TPA: hypothetical protein VFO78_11425 [Candidatus Limnocylindrales bacterium]|nr:hypothetical protein [Candidatus Limnocylindrales bacterium]
MANVAIAALVVVSLGAVILVVLQMAPGLPRRRMRALIGLVPGVVGAFVVAALMADIVPDGFESIALPWVIVAGSIAIVVLIVMNLREH